MEAKKITKYVYKGKEFNSIEALKNHVHEVIGLEVLDKIIRVCPPQKHKDLFNLLNVICSPEVRAVLTEYLNIFVKDDPDCYTGESEAINVLDFKD